MKDCRNGIGAVIVLALWIALPVVLSQPPERIRMTNRHYRSGDWVTYSMTRFVRHLSIGHEEVYFATSGGITRYNFFSNQWQEPFTISDGLASNDIFLVAFDVTTSYLWCISHNSVSYLEPASHWWYNFFFDEMGLNANEKVVSIGFSDDRKVYLLTERQRWFSSDNTSADFHEVPPIDTTSVQWFGRNSVMEPLPPFLHVDYGLTYDPQNRMIIDNHLRQFRITCWLRDRWNTLWLGTSGLGAGRVDLFTMRLELLPYGIWGPVVQTIAVDNDAFWLGGMPDRSHTSGITQWFGSDVIPNYFEPFLLSGFADDRITQIAVEDKWVWVATQNGLIRYNKAKNSWRTFTQSDHLVDNRIEDLLIADNVVWVATRAGLSAVQKKSARQKDSLDFQIIDYANLANVWIYDLDQHEDLIWAATEFGLYFYDKMKKTSGFYRGTLGPGTQRTFAVSCFGHEIWYATEQGISALIIPEAAVQDWPLFNLRNLQLHCRTYRLSVDSLNVWAATQQGIYRLNRHNGRWVHYSMADGLPVDEIYCLYPDGDYLWIGSSAGLTRFYWNAPYRID